MDNTPLDPAIAAMQYGELSFKSRVLTEKNEELTEINDALAKSIRTNSTHVASEQAALDLLMAEVNEMRRVRDKEIALAKNGYEEKEDGLKEQAKEIGKMQKKLEKQEEKIAGGLLTVQAEKQRVDEKERELQIREKALEIKSLEYERVSSSWKEDMIALEDQRREIRAQRQALDNDAKRVQKDAGQVEENKKSLQKEAKKVEGLIEEMRIESGTNARMKRELDETFVIVNNLIAVLRELQDFLVANLKNPDLVTAKFKEIESRISVKLPKE